jgi:hypothetical protein
MKLESINRIDEPTAHQHNKQKANQGEKSRKQKTSPDIKKFSDWHRFNLRNKYNIVNTPLVVY